MECVREAIGPIAAFKLSTSVSGLPRTRSGKTARKSIVDMARNKPLRVRYRALFIRKTGSVVGCFFYRIVFTMENEGT